MKEYNLTKETLDITMEEVLKDLNEMLKGKPVNTVKYGSGKIEEVKEELTFSLVSTPQKELRVVVQLACETGNPVFCLNIGLRSHAIDLGEELTAAFFEYSPILIELARLKKEAEREFLRLEYEKAEKERAEKAAAAKAAKEEAKFLVTQKKAIEELNREQVLDSEYVEPKYYWHIKGFGKYGYLNFFFKKGDIKIDNKHQFVDYVKTKFTEQEYRELCEEFGFDFDIFDREEVEK